MSEKPRPDLTGLGPDQRRYVEELEQMYGARSIRISRNNEFPWGWSFERWISLLTFLAVIVGGIWFGGGEWRWMKVTIARVVTDLNVVVSRVEAVNSHMSVLQRQVDGIDRVTPRLRAAPERPTISRPAFPLDEQFEMPSPREGAEQ